MSAESINVRGYGNAPLPCKRVRDVVSDVRDEMSGMVWDIRDVVGISMRCCVFTGVTAQMSIVCGSCGVLDDIRLCCHDGVG